MPKTNETRIVEAMGWVWEQCTDKGCTDVGRWLKDNSYYGCYVEYGVLPIDLLTNACHCEALISFLNGPDFNVNIEITYTRHNAKVIFRWTDDEGFYTFEIWRGGDWKHGVCDLAIKRIEAMENEKDG